MKRIFEAIILTELFPQSVIDIYVQVLQSDGGKPKRENQNAVKNALSTSISSLYHFVTVYTFITCVIIFAKN